MKVVLISSYPPEPCGIATYAAQTARALREDGHSVRVVTWGQGEGDCRLGKLPRGLRVLGLLRHCRQGEHAILQYVPEFYIDSSTRMGQLFSRLMLRHLFRHAPAAAVVVHEQSWFPPLGSLGPWGRLLWQAERSQWLSARDLCFHNAAAVEAYRKRFRVSGSNARIVSHARHFRANYTGTRAEARRELGLPMDVRLFASVGFITRYKSYETAIRALALVPELSCEFHIVGGPHPRAVDDDRNYIDELEGLAADDARIRLHVGHVDDCAFDRWIAAADAVLLPYRSVTSSGVMARCHVLGTPVIAAQVAGFGAECSPGDHLFADVEELALMLEIWPLTATSSAPAMGGGM